MGFQPAATELARDQQWLDGVLLYLCIGVTVLVLGLLLAVILRFNSRANPTPALLDAADLANTGDPANRAALETLLRHPDGAVRRWLRAIPETGVLELDLDGGELRPPRP